MSRLKETLNRANSPGEFKQRLNIRGEDIGLDTASFGGILSSTEDTPQKALDVLDDIFASSVSIAGDISATGDLTLTDTDTGTGQGPNIELYRNNSSVGDFYRLGTVLFPSKDSAGNKTYYAQILARAYDVTDGTEDGAIELLTMAGGTLDRRLAIVNGVFTWGATGGDQGADTINASGYYIDGSEVVSSKLLFQTTLTASDSANLAWSSLPSGARRIILRLRNLIPAATSGPQLDLTLTEGGTRQTGASDYEWVGIANRVGSASTPAGGGDGSDARIVVAGVAGTGANAIDHNAPGVSGTVIIENPESTTQERAVDFKTCFGRETDGEFRTENGNGNYVTTGTAVDGFDLRMSTGNITSGEVDVYIEIGS